MRWVWRGLSVVGALALAGAIVYFVIAEVKVHREVRNICSQFSGIDCRFHPDDCCIPQGTGLFGSLDDEGAGYEEEPEYNPWTGEYE